MINWQINTQYFIVNNQYCAIAGPTLVPIMNVSLCNITCSQASFTLPDNGSIISFPIAVEEGENNIIPEYYAAFETLLEAQNYYNDVLGEMKNNLDEKILSPKI